MLPQEKNNRASGFSTIDHHQYFWKLISKPAIFYMPELNP